MDYFAEFLKKTYSTTTSKINESNIHEKFPEVIQALDSISDSTPVVGHFKGIYHHLTGEKDRAIQSVDEATRTTAVFGGGISGFAVGGAAGAIAGGALSGAMYDYAASEYHGTAVRSKKALEEALVEPTHEKMFNAYIYPVLDAFTGYLGADIYSSIRNSGRVSSIGKTRTFVVNETKKYFTGPNGEISAKKIVETFVIKNPLLHEHAASVLAQMPKIAAFSVVYPYGKKFLEGIKKD